MRGNPVFEPAAEGSDPPLINQSQQFKGTKQSATSILPAAARWHRAVPRAHHSACPHPHKAKSSPLQFPLQFCWIYWGGKSHSNCRWRPRTKTAPGCLSCVHKKGHLEPFLWSRRMVCHYIMKQLSNVWNKGVLLKEIKTRKARQKKINPIFSVPLVKEKNPLHLNSGFTVLQTQWSSTFLSNWCWKQMGSKGKRDFFFWAVIELPHKKSEGRHFRFPGDRTPSCLCSFLTFFPTDSVSWAECENLDHTLQWP